MYNVAQQQQVNSPMVGDSRPGGGGAMQGKGGKNAGGFMRDPQGSLMMAGQAPNPGALQQPGYSAAVQPTQQQPDFASYLQPQQGAKSGGK